MKPPQFNYVRPDSVEGAVDALAGAEYASILAGGQSLIPTLNFRLASPDTLIDISHIRALYGIEVSDTTINISAMARHREVELSDEVYKANPLLREALGHVAHIVIRNRGTVAGNIAHADAASEMPAVLLATDGSVVAQGLNGVREIAAGDFFQFHLTTALEQDELITGLRFPVLPPRTGWSFQEFTRRRGDYAVAGVCALVTLDENGVCRSASLAACGVAQKPVRLSKAEQALVGMKNESEAISVAATAARESVSAPDDVHASNLFRKDLVSELVTRTVTQATGRALTR